MISSDPAVLPPLRTAIPEQRSVGLVKVMSPDEVTNMRNAEAQARSVATQPESAPIEDSLLSYLNRRWQNAETSKQDILQVMLEDLRQVNSEYDPDDKAVLKEQNAPIIYMRLTAMLKKAADSQILDTIFQNGDKPWGIDPTPIPDLPPPIVDMIKQQAVMDVIRLFLMQGGGMEGQPIPPEAIMMHANRLRYMMIDEINKRAKETAAAMETKIEDQFVEAKFNSVLKEFFSDITALPNAFIKGPIIRRKRTLEWKQTPQGWKPLQGEKVMPTYERVSAFDIYVTDDTRTCQDGTIFHRMQMSRAALIESMDLIGARTAEINEVIEQYYDKGVRNWISGDSERLEMEYRNNHGGMAASEHIEILDCWTTCSGKYLIENRLYATDLGPIEPNKEYEINAWKFKDKILYVVINDHPLGLRPLSTSSWETIVGSFWGRSLPRCVRDKQKIVNAAARSIVRNMEIASGPQVGVDDTQRIPAGENLEEMFPWKIWQFENPKGSTNPPMYFFQANDMTEKLIAVYEHFMKEAHNDAGIVQFTYGSDNVAGAGKTLGGLEILSNNSARGLRLVLSNIDPAIQESVERQFIHNMLFDDDEGIKGDLRVVSRGILADVVRSIKQQKRLTYLQITNNPVDLEIIGLDGRAAVHREVVKELDMPINEVVPSEEEMQQKLVALAQRQMLEQKNPNGSAPSKPPKE